MKRRPTLLLSAGLLPAVLLAGCGYSARDIKNAQDDGYRSGLADGRAGQVRQEFHSEQRSREHSLADPSGQLEAESSHPLLPPLPKRRYYEIPIPAHIASDGVRIEAHTQNIEVIQP